MSNELTNPTDHAFTLTDKIALLEQQALSIKAWIIMTSWFSFSQAFLMPAGQTDLPQQLAKRGIYQILALEKLYMTSRARKELE